ncbi:MAG: VOC family protein [Pigmentiphaga sp.]
MSLPSIEFSHVGIHVWNMETMVGFYQRVLGLVVTDRGWLPGRELTFMSRNPREHHQVVLASGRSGNRDDKVVNQISFRVPTLEGLQQMFRWLQAEPGPTGFRAITHGNAWTLYFYDPEGNRIELFVDAPWYVSQPFSEPLDLNLPPDTIRQETEAMCRTDPSFEPVEVWRERLKARIEQDQSSNIKP